jgi:hypothetical protein
MTSFDHREEAFEAKFAHDEENAFKARARALWMLGLWAAGKRGETGKAAEEYAKVLIEADIDAPDSALNKLVSDLAGHGVDAPEIRQKRDGLLAILQSASA